jgi:hypothetical protein
MENMLAGGWLEFGFSPKTATLCERFDNARCHGARTNCFSTFQPNGRNFVHIFISP